MRDNMQIARTGSLFAAALLSAAAFAQEEPSIPQELAAAAAESERLGELIYRHDQAAWLATDAALTLKEFKKDKRVRGWIVEEGEQGLEVSFVGAPGDAPPDALYRALISTNGMLSGPIDTLDPPQPLTPTELAIFNARKVALATPLELCAKKYNTVVFPGVHGEETTWAVYLLPGTTDAAEVPAGGNYRVDVAFDGSRVVSTRPFTKACVNLRKESEGGTEVAGLMLTHLLDPAPTEIHVFLSLLHKVPLWVLTTQNQYLWRVERGKVRVERKIEAETATP
jgi:hypothetical protein